MKPPLKSEVLFCLSLNFIYFAASGAYYLMLGDTLFGTPHQVLWMPFIVGFYAGHVIFSHFRLSYRYAVIAGLLYSITVAIMSCLLWVGYALIISGFDTSIFNIFSMFPIVMMAMDGLRNTVVMIPMLMLFVWLTRKVEHDIARIKANKHSHTDG